MGSGSGTTSDLPRLGVVLVRLSAPSIKEASPASSIAACSNKSFGSGQTIKIKEKLMNHKFDELTRSLAQSVTRRAAFKQFGIGLPGMALACFGLANRALAQTTCLSDGSICTQNSDCCSGHCKPTQWIDPFTKHREKRLLCAS